MQNGLHIYPSRPLADWLAETDRFIRECQDGTADKRFKLYMKVTYPPLHDARRYAGKHKRSRNW